MQIPTGLLALLAVVLAAAPAAAQAPPNTEERLRRAEQRLDELERDLKARDAKIAELESRQPATMPAATQPSRADEIERTMAEVLRDI